MSLDSYQLTSSHEDPEYWMCEFETDYITVTTHHSPNMPECVARLLHTIEVRKELDSYEMGVKPSPGYIISRWNYDPELAF